MLPSPSHWEHCLKVKELASPKSGFLATPPADQCRDLVSLPGITSFLYGKKQIHGPEDHLSQPFFRFKLRVHCWPDELVLGTYPEMTMRLL